MAATQIMEPGQNCWKVVQANRAAVLIDGQDYYAAFYHAVQQAQSSVIILAWDIDSRMQLIRGEAETAKLPVELGRFLNAILKQRPKLTISILNWDWAMLYTMEREWMPIFRPGWKKQKRLRYELDGECPFGGSQHQKIVVIDDKIAFCGGIDLGKHRWDSAAHAPNDPRRIDPEGQSYPPFHDMMLMVDGEAAKALAEIARSRWFKATQENLPIAESDNSDIWPVNVPVDFEQVDIAVSRTIPSLDEQEEVREIERFYQDAINSAKTCIYIENQYFSSHLVAQALTRRLSEADGPQIIIVCPKQTGGWLEQYTMDVLRQRVSQQLINADQHRRLRICYPYLESLGDESISLHSKMLIVDQQLLHIGSANLSNRSMGLDSECDLTIEAKNTTQQSTIQYIKNRLLCEHLGLQPEELQAELAQHESLINLIDHRQTKPRTLKLLDCTLDAFADELLPTADYVDPERPVDSLTMSRKLVPIDEPASPKKQILIAAAIFLGILLLTVCWKWTPLNTWLQPENLRQAISQFNENPFTPFIVISIFAFLAVLAVPLTLLVMTIALVFGPWPGSLYALLGGVFSALISYYLGGVLGRKGLARLAGSKLHRLSKRLAHHGVMAIITVRLIPVAPYTLINMLAGASDIKLRDFVIGTVIGLLPGIIMIIVFATSLRQVFDSPSVWDITIFVGIVISIGSVLWGMKKWLTKLSAKS